MHTIWRPPKGNILAEFELLSKKKKSVHTPFSPCETQFFAKKFQKRAPRGEKRRALDFQDKSVRLCKKQAAAQTLRGSLL